MKFLSSSLLLVIVMFVFACKKENGIGAPASLIGKWNLVETYADPGNGSEEWKKVTDGTDNYIVFNSSGKLSGRGLDQYSSYKIKDSTTLVFIKKDKTEQNYFYTIKNDSLTMSPAGPIFCIEGCGSRYKKAE